MEFVSYVIDFKGTVKQIEKPLINYRLRISTVSWNMCIPTASNFVVIYREICYFLKT